MTADSIESPTIRVSAIIINEKQEILLIKHRKKDREYWVLPGGHLEFGETIETGTLRELKEETSLTGKFERIVFLSESIAPNNSRHIINIFALVKVFEGQEIIIGSDEDIIAEVKYHDLKNLNELIVYPDIKEEILLNHQTAWTNEQIQFLITKWT